MPLDQSQAAKPSRGALFESVPPYYLEAELGWEFDENNDV